MKTMKDIKHTFSGSLRFGDEIDQEIFDHLQGCVPPLTVNHHCKENASINTDSMSFVLKEQCDVDVKLKGIMQNGEPFTTRNGRFTYMSIGFTDDRYFWLGDLPNQNNVIY